MDLMGFLDANQRFNHDTTVISCFYHANEPDDYFWFCWGDYFDYRSDSDDYMGFKILPWESTLKKHLETHQVIMIYPQRGIFSPDIAQHKNFTYIELPEFYGVFDGFFKHTSQLPAWSNHPSKQILFMAKRASYSRQIMWYNIMEKKFTGYVSYLCEKRSFEGTDGQTTFDHSHKSTLGNKGEFHWCHSMALQHFPELDRYLPLIDSIPYQSDPNLLAINDTYGGWGGWVDDGRMYQDTFLCVVGETFIENPWDQIWTEKIFKPMWFLRPFVLIAGTGALSQLRDLGFETFGAWIDESYDMENDFRRRIQMIISETNRLCSLSSQTHQEMLNQMRPVLEHNRENLAKLNKKLQIRQKEIAKFVVDRV